MLEEKANKSCRVCLSMINTPAVLLPVGVSVSWYALLKYWVLLLQRWLTLEVSYPRWSSKDSYLSLRFLFSEFYSLLSCNNLSYVSTQQFFIAWAQINKTASNYRGKILGAIATQLLIKFAVEGWDITGQKPIVLVCNNMGVVKHGNDPKNQYLRTSARLTYSPFWRI